MQLRIGDPNVLVSGQQRYVISYVLENAINPQEDQDEFYWNVTGSDHEVSIQTAAAVVTAPSVKDILCFQGPTGSSEACNASHGLIPSICHHRNTLRRQRYDNRHRPH